MNIRDLGDGVIESEATMPPSCGGTLVSVAALVPSQRSPQRPTTGIDQEFVIKNETDLEIPRYFLPDGEEFSPYSSQAGSGLGPHPADAAPDFRP